MPEHASPSPDFSLQVSRHDAGTRLAPRGELDLTTAPELEAALRDHLPQGDVVLDLSELSFLDSTGLRLLLSERERGDREGFALRVTGARDDVARVFEISGFNHDLTPRGLDDPVPARPVATDPAERERVAVQRLSERYPAVPESVAHIRHAVADFARAAGARDEAVSAIGLAVSEAATNAVVHAYADAPEPGPVDVAAGVEGDELWISVCDQGGGMKPRPDSPGLGLGLPLIAQMTTGFEVREGEAGGTEVFLRFAL